MVALTSFIQSANNKTGVTTSTTDLDNSIGTAINSTIPSNAAPVANAGPDQNVTTGSTVTLNGSGSSDADGDVLTYSWTFISRPTGSAAALSNISSVNPTFTADKDGAYVITVTVNDGKASSVIDTVTITAAATTNSGGSCSVEQRPVSIRGIRNDGKIQTDDFTYDSNGYLISQVNVDFTGNTTTTAITNDAKGNPLTITNSNGYYITMTYDADGNRISTTIKDPSGNYAYNKMTYDIHGNILTLVAEDSQHNVVATGTVKRFV